MGLKVRTFRAGSPRESDEGLRIGTVRFLPRGVKKADYAKRDYFDVWFPEVAPSGELVKQGIGLHDADDKSWKRFEAKYRKEMTKTGPRQSIQLLAEIAKKYPIAVGCYCENESRCHRSILLKLIQEAAEKK